MNARKFTQTALLALFLLGGISTQAQWTQSVTGINANLLDIHFPDPVNGYAVGENGMIIKTEDSGTSWNTINSPVTTHIRSCYWITESFGWIATEDGLFSTVTGGVNWTQQPLSGTNNVHHVEFIDLNTGFCTGNMGTIYKTSDGGFSWSEMIVNNPTTSNNAVIDISFPTPAVGYASMSGYNWVYLKTTDGGATWNEDGIAPIQNLSNMSGIHFTSETKGFTVGWYIAAFAGTTDGGSNWATSTAGDVDLFTIDFANANSGIAAGLNGQVVQTFDGGATWSLDTIHNTSVLWNASCFDGNGGAYIAGGDGLIYKQANAVGVDEQTLVDHDIAIFPNPTSGNVSIALSEPVDQVEVTVTDMSGRTISSAVFVNPAVIQLDIAGNAGFYFVRLHYPSGESVVRKILKQ